MPQMNIRLIAITNATTHLFFALFMTRGFSLPLDEKELSLGSCDCTLTEELPDILHVYT